MRTKRIILVGILFLLSAFHVKAQEKEQYYYYYMDEKQYLTLDKMKFNITTTPEFDESVLEDGLKLLYLAESVGAFPTKFGRIQFLSEPSDAEYDQKVRSLRSREDVIGVHPNFLSARKDSIGMSSILFVKLKESSDYALLEEFAKQRNAVIVEQDKYMPLWYSLQCTREADDNTLSVANIFYESGLFASAEPSLLSFKYHGVTDMTVATAVVQCKLYQNISNPFSEDTQIGFYIPESVTLAQLCIYNMQGIQLEKILITQRGEGSQKISGSELAAGMYLYALIVDGQEVDTKRMVLIK